MYGHVQPMSALSAETADQKYVPLGTADFNILYKSMHNVANRLSIIWSMNITSIKCLKFYRIGNYKMCLLTIFPKVNLVYM